MSTPALGSPSIPEGVRIFSSFRILRPESSSISLMAFRTPRVTSSNGASTVVGASPRKVWRYSFPTFSMRMALVVVLPQSVAPIVRSGRSVMSGAWSLRPRLDQRCEPRERVPSLEQAGDTFHVPLREDCFKNRSEDMQRLAAEEIHGPDGFQKEDGGGGHAPLDHGGRGAVEQRDIGRRKRFGW